MLLHLEDNELAVPPSDLLTHAAKKTTAELDSGITVNLISDNKKDPPTLWHAQRSKYWNEWLIAMHEELKALKAKNVYEEVEDLPHGRKAVQCKWVLHIKWDKDGQISQFKGRLVTKGFTQILGQDYTFTFVPVT